MQEHVRVIAQEWAVEKNYEEVAKYLIDIKIRSKVCYEGIIRFVFSKSIHYDRINIAKYIIDKLINVHEDISDLLLIACEFDNLTIIEYLVKKGANINAKNSKCLEKALENSCANVARYLSNKGANLPPYSYLIYEYINLAIKENNTAMLDYYINYHPSKICRLACENDIQMEG